MNTRSLMVAGTASHVGKSWITTAICRALARRGLRVAPFKAQNMSNNSYPCRAGGEIGRAQVAQAYACYLEPEPDMNPILLKPNSDTGSQVVVNGKVWKTLPAREYYEQFPYLLRQVLAAYRRLSERFDVIVMEGAGSITELNLKHTDLVNLGLATRTRTPVLLVSDIDRGGVFASVAGTFGLLDAEEKPLVRGFAVNRFRGDPTLFDAGRVMLEELTGKPCLGVFPYLPDAPLDAEDGVALDSLLEKDTDSDVAVIGLPHISNLTDFKLIAGAHRITKPVAKTFRTVILPGTKNTIGDLLWLRGKGLDKWIAEQHRNGATVLGICGGYQMMGRGIEDPHAMESSAGSIEGLGLLPVRTVLQAKKTTRAVRAVTASGHCFDAYEIHLGETVTEGLAVPFASLEDGSPEGMRQGRCMGTYLHGALEDSAVLSELLGRPVAPLPSADTTYNLLADWFEASVNWPLFEELYLCG